MQTILNPRPKNLGFFFTCYVYNRSMKIETRDKFEEAEKIFKNIPSQFDRGLFILHILWGLSYAELAYCFNMPKEQIEQRIKETQLKASTSYESQSH